MSQTIGEFFLRPWMPSSDPILTCSRPNIYFNITSPSPGTFIISLHYKGREKAILEMDLKIDDLLEKVCTCHFCLMRYSPQPIAKR